MKSVMTRKRIYFKKHQYFLEWKFSTIEERDKFLDLGKQQIPSRPNKNQSLPSHIIVKVRPLITREN